MSWVRRFLDTPVREFGGRLRDGAATAGSALTLLVLVVAAFAVFRLIWHVPFDDALVVDLLAAWSVIAAVIGFVVGWVSSGGEER